MRRVSQKMLAMVMAAVMMFGAVLVTPTIVQAEVIRTEPVLDSYSEEAQMHGAILGAIAGVIAGSQQGLVAHKAVAGTMVGAAVGIIGAAVDVDTQEYVGVVELESGAESFAGLLKDVIAGAAAGAFAANVIGNVENFRGFAVRAAVAGALMGTITMLNTVDYIEYKSI